MVSLIARSDQETHEETHGEGTATASWGRNTLQSSIRGEFARGPTLTLLYTIFTEKLSLSYTFLLKKDTPFTYLIRTLHPFSKPLYYSGGEHQADYQERF